MRAILLALALCLSGTAFAQTLGLTINGASTTVVTPNDCLAVISVTWTASSAGSLACSDLTLWATTATSCSDTPAASDVVLTGGTVSANTWVSQGTGTATITVQKLPNFSSSADGGTVCAPGQQIQQTATICGSFKYGNSFTGCASSTTYAKPSSPPTVVVDGQPPAAPTLDSVTPLDSALQVTATSVDSDTAIIHMEYRATGDTDFTSGGTFSATAGSGKITGLTNGQSYDVQVRGEDSAGNIGDPSPSQTATPVHTEGFFDRYQAAGGEETGGCTTGSGGPLAAVGAALLAGFFFSRRRRG